MWKFQSAIKRRLRSRGVKFIWGRRQNFVSFLFLRRVSFCSRIDSRRSRALLQSKSDFVPFSIATPTLIIFLFGVDNWIDEARTNFDFRETNDGGTVFFLYEFRWRKTFWVRWKFHYKKKKKKFCALQSLIKKGEGGESNSRNNLNSAFSFCFRRVFQFSLRFSFVNHGNLFPASRSFFV